MINSHKKEGQAAYNNKEHNGWLIDQETIVVRTYPVRWNAPNRRAIVQPRMQISKLQTNRHTSSEQIQACRPTGVKNYMHGDVFHFLSFFLSIFVSFLFFFLEIKHTSLTPYRHDKTTSWPPHRHKRTSGKLIAPQA